MCLLLRCKEGEFPEVGYNNKVDVRISVLLIQWGYAGLNLGVHCPTFQKLGSLSRVLP